jgi:hypothetical protein
LALADVLLVAAVEARGTEGAALTDLASVHGQPDRATTRRALQRAAELGLVELTGRGRGARWRPAADLSDPAVWRAAAEHAGVLGRSALARRRVEVERADYRAWLEETWAHRVEQADHAKHEWRRTRQPARCEATTQRGSSCHRPVDHDDDRCAWHTDNPQRCGHPTRNGAPCRRPVPTADDRCPTHLTDDATDTGVLQPPLTNQPYSASS